MNWNDKETVESRNFRVKQRHIEFVEFFFLYFSPLWFYFIRFYFSFLEHKNNNKISRRYMNNGICTNTLIDTHFAAWWNFYSNFLCILPRNHDECIQMYLYMCLCVCVCSHRMTKKKWEKQLLGSKWNRRWQMF